MAVSRRSEYFFYVYHRQSPLADDGLSTEDLSVHVFSPSWCHLRVNKLTGIIFYLFWYWFSTGRYLIYFVEAEGEIVHVSHVLTRNPKFAFMAKADREIGPCWTHPDFRGRGIYSRVLQRIVRDFGSQKGRLFIFAESGNAASLKGITKAGFSYFGSGKKTSPWGIYRVTDLGGGDPNA